MFIVQSLFEKISDHFRKVMIPFEPLTQVQSFNDIPRIDQLNSTYRLTFLVSLLLAVDFVYEHILHESFILPDSTTELLRVVTYHWPATAEQKDVIIAGAYSFGLAYSANLYFDRFQHIEWFMYFEDKKSFVVSRGRKLPSKLSRVLIAYWSKLNPRMKLIRVLSIIDGNLAFTLPFYFAEVLSPVPNINLIWRATCWLICPIFVVYNCLAVTFGNYFWLNLRYLLHKQDYYIRQFQRLVRRLQVLGESRELLGAYLKIVKHLVLLMREIRASNAFYSKYETATLCIYSMEICYVAFAIVTSGSVKEKFQLVPVTLLVGLYAVYIFVISLNCSRIVHKNCQIHEGIREFNVHCRRKVSILFRLKMETFDCFQRFFRKSAFRLLNNYTIDLRLFEMLGSWILILSLKLFGRQLAAYF